MNRNGHKLNNNNLSVHEFFNWKTSATAILKFLLEYKNDMGQRHGLRLRIWIDNDDYYATYLTRQQRFYKHKSQYQPLIPNLLQREREI